MIDDHDVCESFKLQTNIQNYCAGNDLNMCNLQSLDHNGCIVLFTIVLLSKPNLLVSIIIMHQVHSNNKCSITT